jgi:hypothetical protein
MKLYTRETTIPPRNRYFVFSPWNPSTNVLPALWNPWYGSSSEVFSACTWNERSATVDVVTARQNIPRSWVRSNDFSKPCIISLSDNGGDADDRSANNPRLLSGRRKGETKRDRNKEVREAAWGNDLIHRAKLDAIIGCEGFSGHLGPNSIQNIYVKVVNIYLLSVRNSCPSPKTNHKSLAFQDHPLLERPCLEVQVYPETST